MALKSVRTSIKTFLSKVGGKTLFPLLLFVAGCFLLNQYQFSIAHAIWDSKNIKSYMIDVKTEEVFGSSNKVITTCIYNLDVTDEKIELGDISCENNTKERLSFLGSDMTVPGLINLANKFQSTMTLFNSFNSNFGTSLNWQYGFPQKIFFSKDDNSYQVTITVEDFKIYR